MSALVTQEALGAALDRDGFAGPFPLYSAAACVRVLSRLVADERNSAPAWNKGYAAVGPAFHDVATDVRVLDLVRPALGDDFVLWGAQLIRKRSGEVHPFHSDVESCGPEGGFASVWIGLENTGRQSGLMFISGSHRFGMTIQESNFHAGVARHDSTEQTAFAAARRLDPASRLEQPDVHDGEALVFDGRTWHGSHNSGDAGTRTALLLQFARADRAVRIPADVQWPISVDSASRPPVLTVSGRPLVGLNGHGLAPTPGGIVENGVYLLPDRPVAALQPFAFVPHFQGRTPNADDMEAHTSVLAPGHQPHGFQSHVEEELLVVMDGELDLTVADDAEGRNSRTERLGRGDFAYYRAFLPHTLRNRGTVPALYTPLKWRSARAVAAPTLSALFIRAGAMLRDTSAERSATPLFEGRTKWLSRLHAHWSVMPPGAEIESHADHHDVAILLFEGELRTLGQNVGAPALIYHPAGEPHGLKSMGEAPARYLVFEFEAAPPADPAPPDGGETRKQALKRILRPYLGPAYRRLRSLLAK